jgi:hypothetical protein
MNRFPAVLAASLVLLPAGARSETVHASRVIHRVTVNAGALYKAIAVPQQGLAEYCADADGCKITLKLADGPAFEAKSTHLYFGESDSLVWLSEASTVTGLHRDGDGTGEQAASVLLGFYANCGLGDWDPVGDGSDSIPGFVLGVVPAPGSSATCTLVVED